MSASEREQVPVRLKLSLVKERSEAARVPVKLGRQKVPVKLGRQKVLSGVVAVSQGHERAKDNEKD